MFLGQLLAVRLLLVLGSDHFFLSAESSEFRCILKYPELDSRWSSFRKVPAAGALAPGPRALRALPGARTFRPGRLPGVRGGRGAAARDAARPRRRRQQGQKSPKIRAREP